MTSSANVLDAGRPRYPWTYTLLELLPAAGWLGLVGSFLGWRAVHSVAGDTSRFPPLVEEAVVLVAIAFLLLFIPLLFASTAAMLFAYGIGWIASGRVVVGIVTGIPRGVLTVLMVNVAASGDEYLFADPAWFAVFGQLAVLSIISAAALWSTETGRSSVEPAQRV
jgi:hypothetical protein